MSKYCLITGVTAKEIELQLERLALVADISKTEYGTGAGNPSPIHSVLITYEDKKREFSYRYPMPGITVDIIVYDRRANEVLLVKRDRAPFEGDWSIPGGFFNPIDHDGEKADTSLKAAAIRELKEETNIDAQESDLSPLTIMDAIGRDPRGRTITPVYILTLWDGKPANVKAGDDAGEIAWVNLDSLIQKKIPLAFDHHEEILAFSTWVTLLPLDKD